MVMMIAATSCHSDYYNEMSTPQKTGVVDVDNEWTYTWKSCQPQELTSAPTVVSLNKNSNRGYPSVKCTFAISLNNSTINPTIGFDVNTKTGNLEIPHVGPKVNGTSTVIYTNVDNDATYTIESVDKVNGTVTISIATDVPTSPGYTDLLFNVSVLDNNKKHNWFTAYGKYSKSKNLGYDDGKNNIFGFRIYTNKVEPMF